MNERTFTTEFIKKNTINGCFEIKFTSKNSIPFSSIQEHQKAALLAVSCGDGLSWKIADSPFFKDPKDRMRFTHKKNFDVVRLTNVEAYIVAVFYTPRHKKNVIYIDIERFVRMEEETTRKSFTEQMAIDYSAFSFSYLKRS